MRRPLPSWGRVVMRPMRTRTWAVAVWTFFSGASRLRSRIFSIGAPWPIAGELAVASSSSSSRSRNGFALALDSFHEL